MPAIGRRVSGFKRLPVANCLYFILAGIRHLMFIVMIIISLMEPTSGQCVGCSDGE